MPNQFPMFSRENYNMEARTKWLDAQRQKELDAELTRIRATVDADKQRQIDVARDQLQNAKNLLAEREKLQKEEEDRNREKQRTGLEQVIATEFRKQQQGSGYRFPGTDAFAKQHSEHAMRWAEAAPAMQQATETNRQLGMQKYAESIAEALGQMNIAESNVRSLLADTTAAKTTATRDAVVENELAKLLSSTAINKAIASDPDKFASPAITAAETRANASKEDNSAAEALAAKFGLGGKQPTGTPATNTPPARIKLDSLSTGTPPNDPNKATLPTPPSADGPPDSEGRSTSPLGGDNAELLKILKSVLEKLSSQSNNLPSIPGIAR